MASLGGRRLRGVVLFVGRGVVALVGGEYIHTYAYIKTLIFVKTAVLQYTLQPTG